MAHKAPPGPPLLDASARVVILHGPEVFLHASHTEELRAALGKARGEVEVFRFDGQSAAPADVLDECRSFGLMARHKLVVVDHADQVVKEGARPLFERYAQNPCDMATLVLRSTKWHAGKLDEMASAVVRCEPPSLDEAPDRACAMASKRHGARLERDAAVALVDRVGSDLGLLDTELAKLATAAVDPDDPKAVPVITAELVSTLTGRTREEEVWDVQSALLGGDPGHALSRLRDMIVISGHSAPPLAYAFMDLARKVHSLSRAVRGGKNPWSLRGPLRLWGPTGDRIMELAKQTDPDRAHRLFRATVEADARSKSGFGEAERGLEILALRFGALTRRR
ncbi:MAG: hypothetical protein FJ255_05970 [Phycisphaerae bacterium]|nr:hypothetical protein [Phycisphaerae bacterium]